ncbi:hypothetical protein P3T42_005998 [Paraburkholderia sp. GAS38]|uniref:hypothetical protein n=1 Tax=Paraburkholderia sp. GAS38 TaxID=3035133 RepID=UPI003D197D40
MEHYKNLGGNSGVYAYEISIDAIKVQFQDGAVYPYDYSATGHDVVEQMKRYAIAGRGLNSYIKRFANKRYAARLK